MKMVPLSIKGACLLTPLVHHDDRGSFAEVYHEETLLYLGWPKWVQENTSRSHLGVLRGLHLQEAPHAQAKLVRCTRGTIFDVIVDLRPGPDFGRWTSVDLSEANYAQLFIPEGCAHGFVATSQIADVTYKCSRYYAPSAERTLRWDDPTVGVEWPIAEPFLSEKDKRGLPLAYFHPRSVEEVQL